MKMLFMLMAGASAAGMVASPAQAAPKSYNVPAQPLSSALQQFALQGGQQVIFSPEALVGKRSRAVSGSLESEAALRRLLDGAGVTYRRAGRSYVIAMRDTPRPHGAAVQPPVAPAAPVTDGPAPALGLEEIVVTAQKREQNLQDVPIAISALSSAFLEKRDITSINNLSALAPNLKIDTAANSQTSSIISIRGGVQGNPQLYFEPSVGLYMDGVYIAKAQGSLFDIADIERIEVLRGPQGTLYGRNAVAGAVNLVTRKPSGEFNGRIEASYANYDFWRLRGSIDLPRLGIFSAKISGQIAKRDGFYHVRGNAFTDEANSLDSKSAMIQVRAEPFEALTLDYVFDISDIKMQTGYAQPVSGTGSLAPYILPRRRVQNVSFDSPNFENSRNWGHALTATLDLGAIGTFKAITALRKQNSPQALDLDGTPVPFATATRDSHYRQFSQELQLTGQTGPLNYVLGAYYFDDKGNTDSFQSFLSGLSRTETNYAFTTKAYAAYAQLDYKLTDALTLTGGLRYTHEKKTVERYLARLTAAGPVVVINLPAGATPPATFEKVSPTATLAYEFGPGLNVYARYAQGFRSGGFNATANTTADVRRVFRPQVQNTYEVGFKSRLLDNRLQLNVAAFQNDVSDLQLSVFLPGISASSILVNAGKARIRGVEIEAVARPDDRLTVQAGLGYLQSKFLQYLDNGANVADNRAFPHAPRYTVSTSVDWTAMETDMGKLNLIADLNMTSEYYVSPLPIVPTAPTQTAAYLVRTPGRVMLGARAVLSQIPMGSIKGTLSVWGKNLLNEKNPNFFIDYGASLQRLITAYFPDPRTYGLTLGIRF
ncbi:TonB-dependent receptor domain-containing protein [Sphingobium estronivorans]|uniref:TonB-dependent receptor domain-containing protein n=1 Tax=Sphingobium estronivorans TaxID=1577690 RepID=UPI00123BE905|nr:TonB-dependent receptor [Sphingobium estronivorans]